MVDRVRVNSEQSLRPLQKMSMLPVITRSSVLRLCLAYTNYDYEHIYPGFVADCLFCFPADLRLEEEAEEWLLVSL